MPEEKKAPTVTWRPMEEEKKVMIEDWEKIRYMKDYRSRFEPQMLRAAKAWNLLADPVDDDRISNVLIPIARMLASTAIAAMTEGRPGFGFRPGATSDYIKVPLWESAIDQVLNENNFEAQQNLFITDYTVLGCGVYDVTTQMPMRTVRYPKEGGGFASVHKRDYRRSKISIKARSPWETWFWPNARTIEENPITYDEEYINEALFNQDYRDAVLPDGTKKYKHTDSVKSGFDFSFSGQSEMYRVADRDNITIGRIQNETGDVLREYANGVLILDKTLQIKNINGVRCEGVNCLGMTSLCFGPNNHQYDSNLKTHALWWMGDPYMIRGLDAIYQAFGNMTIDNWRLANTKPISFKPFGSTTAQDLDIRDFYSGKFIDGDVITTSLGDVRLSDYQFFQELLDNWCIWLTGVNFKQLIGETSRTKFEFEQRIKAQNRRFEYKIRALESGCFQKLGRLLLADVMSEMTVEDYENLTEQEIEDIQKKIKDKQVRTDDYENLLSKDSAKPPRRKVRTMIQVKDKVYKERNNTSEKRLFSPESYEENTLVLDKKAKGNSEVPAIPEYLWSQEYIERGGIPDVFVMGNRMLSNLKDLKFIQIQEVSNYARVRVAEGLQNQSLQTNFDLQKIDTMFVRGADVYEEEVMTIQNDEARNRKDKKSIIDELAETPADQLLPSQSPYGDISGQPFPEMASPTSSFNASRPPALRSAGVNLESTLAESA